MMILYFIHALGSSKNHIAFYYLTSKTLFVIIN